MSTQNLDRHIEMTPGVTGGKPRIAGRRITVAHIAIWHTRQGRSIDEICSDYDLTLGEVHAALAYYYDHRVEIDESIRRDDEIVEAVRASTPSILKERLKEQDGD